MSQENTMSRNGEGGEGGRLGGFVLALGLISWYSIPRPPKGGGGEKGSKNNFFFFFFFSCTPHSSVSSRSLKNFGPVRVSGNVRMRFAVDCKVYMVIKYDCFAHILGPDRFACLLLMMPFSPLHLIFLPKITSDW